MCDKINVLNGDIYQGLRSNDLGFKNFGEVYFSFIKFKKTLLNNSFQILGINRVETFITLSYK